MPAETLFSKINRREVPADIVYQDDLVTAFRDRGLKRDRYARFGVPEYWIVDADARKIEIYRLKENSNRPAEIATGSFTRSPSGGYGTRRRCSLRPTATIFGSG